jgi:hypothetical protein
MSLQTGSDPSALLTAALEKLLYLESRLDSAEAAREEATRETERQRHAVYSARQALADWQKRATDAEVATEGAEREVSVLRSALAQSRQAQNAAPREAELAAALQAAEDRLARFATERETWLDRMVVLQRLGSGSDELDLGAFISELRAELLALRRGDTRAPATVSDRPAAPDAQTIVNEAPGGDIDVDALIAHARLPRAERTLATLCSRDLRSEAAVVRRRAAERLVESRISALTPFISALFQREPESSVRVVYVRLIDLSASETATIALQRAQLDSDPRVRAVAVDALARRGHLDSAQALRDASPAIRRRAIAHLARNPAAIDAVTDALRDEDASVRHVAAISLAGRSGKEASEVLRVASRSGDREVREVAAQSLERRQAAPAPPPAPSSSAVGSLARLIIADVRTALRGRTVEELAETLTLPPEGVLGEVERMLADGQLVWRGKKLFLP